MLASPAVRGRRYPLLLAALAGCGPSGSGDLLLGWRFADGRRCAEAGASLVVASVDGAKVGAAAGWQCPDGDAGAAVLVPDVPREGGRLTLEARSPSGTALYRGDEALPGTPATPPATLTVTLYYTGGR